MNKPQTQWDELLTAAKALLEQIKICQPVDIDGHQFSQNGTVRDLQEIVKRMG